MKLEEFNETTITLENFFDKSLNPEERKTWYATLKGLDIAVYRKLVYQAKINCKYLPKLKEIMDLKANLQLQQEGKTKEPVKVQCSKCSSTGMIKYTKNIEGYPYEYYALCHCENVQNIPSGLRKRMYTAQQLGI